MTDTLTDQGPDPLDFEEDWEILGLSKWVCKTPGCENHTPIGDGGRKRYYCDEHQAKKTDAKPTSIKVQIGSDKSAKKTDELEMVRARAEQLAGLVSTLIMFVGSAEDSEVIAKNAAQWAVAVRNLAQYEKWLLNLAKGGETSGRTLAWIGVVMSTLTMLVPILMNHDALPDTLKPLVVMLGAVPAASTDASPTA
jgi:hypothetical protein